MSTLREAARRKAIDVMTRDKIKALYHRNGWADKEAK